METKLYSGMIVTHELGSERIDFPVEMTREQALRLVQETGHVYILEGVLWRDGMATIRLIPGRGVAFLAQRDPPKDMPKI
jgi:hypothetical protein